MSTMQMTFHQRKQRQYQLAALISQPEVGVHEKDKCRCFSLSIVADPSNAIVKEDSFANQSSRERLRRSTL